MLANTGQARSRGMSSRARKRKNRIGKMGYLLFTFDGDESSIPVDDFGTTMGVKEFSDFVEAHGGPHIRRFMDKGVVDVDDFADGTFNTLINEAKILLPLTSGGVREILEGLIAALYKCDSYCQIVGE
jgi:hypothetical protein